MKKMNINRRSKRDMRHKRITNRLKKDTNTKPRLIVTKTNNHLFVQVVDDAKGHTLASSSTLALKVKGTIANAKLVGADIAKKTIAANINSVVFDRGGNKYHGQVKALAESARENGLKF
jgi:large subunit ribosomal protein L18